MPPGCEAWTEQCLGFRGAIFPLPPIKKKKKYIITYVLTLAILLEPLSPSIVLVCLFLKKKKKTLAICFNKITLSVNNIIGPLKE